MTKPKLEPENYWIVSEHADVVEVMKEENSSNNFFDHLDNPPKGWENTIRFKEKQELDAGGLDKRPFLFLDNPRHNEVKSHWMHLFVAKNVRELEPFVESLSKELLEKANLKDFDLIKDYTLPLLMGLTLKMLNIKEFYEQKDRLLECAPIMSRAGAQGREFLMKSKRSGEDYQEEIDWCIRLFTHIMIDRLSTPNGDLISNLIHEEKMELRDIGMTLAIVLTAGIDTLNTSFASAIISLSKDKELQEELRSLPLVSRTAINEFLRTSIFSKGWGVVLKRDVVINDVEMQKGMYVWCDFAYANRDPKVFPTPEVIWLERIHNPHVSFGSGIHTCLGALISQMVMRVGLQNLLELTSDFNLLKEPELLDMGSQDVPLSVLLELIKK